MISKMEVLHLVQSKEDKIYYLLPSKETSISEEIFTTGNYDKRYFDQTLNLFPFDKLKNKSNIFLMLGQILAHLLYLQQNLVISKILFQLNLI